MRPTGVDYWVTGSSGHLGRQLVEQLTTEGYSVLGLDIASRNSDTNSRFVFAKVDLRLSEDVEKALPGLPTPKKGFVHLAALTGSISELGWGGDLGQQSLEIWLKTLDVNVTSAFLLAREIVRRSGPLKPGDDSFAMVFASSIYGTLAPDPALYADSGVTMMNPAAYGVSKSGLDALAKYLSSTTKGEVRANTVAAGGIERGQNQRFISNYSNRTAVGRMATEEDIVNAIRFLLSRESTYIFGQTILVDGGFSIR